MNSRERVLTALSHKEPDKVPLDLNGTLVTALTRTAYDGLRKYLNYPIDKEPIISSREMDTVRSLDDLLMHYQIDTRCIHFKSGLLTKSHDVPDGTYYDDFGIHWKKASYYYDAIERPLAGLTDWHDLDKVKWPELYDKSKVLGLKEYAKNLYENTGYCLVADIPGLGPFEGACFVRGHDQVCIDLCLDPDFANALFDKMTDTIIAFWDLLLTEVGEYVQVVAQGDDVGMQNSTMISPEQYREFIKPRHKRMYDFIKTKTKAKIFYHSCGSVYSLIPDFIEAGVDILNPIQRSAANMEIERLKKEFGKDICFWGGAIDVQKQLPYYTPQQIDDEIKRTLDIMAPGGGYIFFPSHNIQADVAPESIDALYKAGNKYRNYSNKIH